MALYRRASRQSAEGDRLRDAAISRFTRGPRRNGASASRDAGSGPTCARWARDAVRATCCSAPGATAVHRGAARVCFHAPTVTSCVRARPSGPNTPPNHSPHAMAPSGSAARPAVAQIRPAHRRASLALDGLDRKPELVRAQEVLHGVERSRRRDQRGLRWERPRQALGGRTASTADAPGAKRHRRPLEHVPLRQRSPARFDGSRQRRIEMAMPGGRGRAARLSGTGSRPRRRARTARPFAGAAVPARAREGRRRKSRRAMGPPSRRGGARPACRRTATRAGCARPTSRRARGGSSRRPLPRRQAAHSAIRARDRARSTRRRTRREDRRRSNACPPDAHGDRCPSPQAPGAGRRQAPGRRRSPPLRDPGRSVRCRRARSRRGRRRRETADPYN